MASKDEVEFLLEDYRETWTQYRHVEDERLRYLTFYFTASIGSAAIAAPVLFATGMDSRVQLLSAAGFLGVFQAVTFFVSVTVRRLGMVLRHYGKVLWNNRLMRAKVNGVPATTAIMMNVRGKTRARRPAWMHSVQKTAEVTLFGFSSQARFSR
jgi:hypothetical protein